MGESGKTLFTEPALVVTQKPNYFGVNYVYSIADREGEPIGSVRRVGHSVVTKLLRHLSLFDTDLRHTLHIFDVQGNVVLELARPSQVVKLRSRLIVRDGNGHDVGEIVEQKAFSDPFSLESGGTPCGSIVRLSEADADYSIRDVLGTEVARITETYDKSHVRALAKIVLTSANNYLVEVHRPLDDPLRSLVVAAALAVDLAFNQDDLE